VHGVRCAVRSWFIVHCPCIRVCRCHCLMHSPAPGLRARLCSSPTHKQAGRFVQTRNVQRSRARCSHVVASVVWRQLVSWPCVGCTVPTCMCGLFGVQDPNLCMCVHHDAHAFRFQVERECHAVGECMPRLWAVCSSECLAPPVIQLSQWVAIRCYNSVASMLITKTLISVAMHGTAC